MTFANPGQKAIAETFIRRKIEELAVSVHMGPAAAKTAAGTPYITFVNGKVNPEGESAPPWEGTPEELFAASIAGVAAYVEALPGPHKLIWRAPPQLEVSTDAVSREVRPITYMRLAFEPAGEAPANATTAAPVAVVANIDDPNIDIVHTLERLLALAVAGDLRAFAYVTVAKAGIVGSSWVGAEDGHLHTLTSGAARLAQRLTAEDGH